MKITSSQLKQIIKEEISKVLSEQEEELVPGVHFPKKDKYGTYAAIVFKFDGMNFEGREEELEDVILEELADDRIYPDVNDPLVLEGNMIKAKIRQYPKQTEEEFKESVSYIRDIYDVVNRDLLAKIKETLAQQELDL